MAAAPVVEKVNPCYEESDSYGDEIDSPVDDSDVDKDYQLSDYESDVENSPALSFSEEDNEVLPAKIQRITDVTPDKKPKSRWRQTNEARYARIKRKLRRNMGQEYLSDSTNKVVNARELGPACSCKNKCKQKLNGEEENLFHKFWDLASQDLQNSYLFGCIEIVKKKRSYPKKQKRQHSSRTCNAIYTVTVNGQNVKVCKTAFLNVHGLQSSRGRINRIVLQKIQGASISGKDKRGKHSNRPNKLSAERKQSVRDHIDQIPKYQSHYSRTDNSGKVYLNCDMSISRLYSEFYVPWCEEQHITPVLENVYRKIFCTEYNIGFKIPKSDTCKTCDETNIKIEAALQQQNNHEVQNLTTQLNLHKLRAKGMQDLLKSETEYSKSNPKTCVISVDLQQAMPIPKLTTGPAFYCRKVWLYNLGIHDCTAGKGYMYVWTEDKAKRGSDEVATILLKFLNTKVDVENLVIFTDNCPGQNKNWLLTALWLQLVKEEKFKTINHHFLVVGHTHLPSDRDFALIEKRQRKYAPVIFSPEEWYKIIREANKKNPFVVTVMEQSDFLNFEPILASIKKSARTTEGDNLDFSGVYSFLFKTENTKAIYVKHTVNGSYKEANIGKKGRPSSIVLTDLHKKYSEPVKIAKKKLDNIKSLYRYMPPINLPFFEALKSADDENLENVEIIE